MIYKYFLIKFIIYYIIIYINIYLFIFIKFDNKSKTFLKRRFACFLLFIKELILQFD